MNNTRLILIEGLPGSGKTTAARITGEILESCNIENKVFFEGEPDHPADYEAAAFFTTSGFLKITGGSADSMGITGEAISKVPGGIIVHYGKLLKNDGLSKNLIERFIENDVYNLPLDRHMEIVMDRWSGFVKKAMAGNDVHVFECCFIQNPVTVAFVRDGHPAETAIKYVLGLEKIIRDLNPLLIYLDPGDDSRVFLKAVESRSGEWLNFFINYYTGQGYGRRSGLSGIDGAAKVLEERRKIELDIIKRLGIVKTIIGNAQFDVSRLQKELKKTLKTGGII
ncbi:MAG: hypothetical protein JXB33_05150 [Clostridia bacterium]|nr:hypothetical protein [Clostridia bacterium]